jgi:hypothetical protein
LQHLFLERWKFLAEMRELSRQVEGINATALPKSPWQTLGQPVKHAEHGLGMIRETCRINSYPAIVSAVLQ